MAETETRLRRLPPETQTLTIFLETRPRRALIRIETVSRPRRRDRDHNPALWWVLPDSSSVVGFPVHIHIVHTVPWVWVTRRCMRFLQVELPDAQLSQRARCRVRYSFGQKWKIGTGRQYFTDIIFIIFNHNRPENLSNSVKKRKIRAITAFKVIEVGTNRKPVCDFLLVINIVTDILSRTVSELSQLIVQTSVTAFVSHPLAA